MATFTSPPGSPASHSSMEFLREPVVQSPTQKVCLSTLVTPAVGPAIREEAKRKRRRKVNSEEEREQRKLERKRKNRESAMRSRQRVMNEMQKNKKEIESLKEENEQQKQTIARLTAELQEARQLLQKDPLLPKPEDLKITESDLDLLFPQMSFSLPDLDYSETASFGVLKSLLARLIFSKHSETSSKRKGPSVEVNS